MAKKKKDLPSAVEDALADPEQNWADREESAAYVAAVKLYKTIMKTYCSDCDPNALAHIYGMAAAYTMVDALKHAGKNPIRKVVGLFWRALQLLPIAEYAVRAVQHLVDTIGMPDGPGFVVPSFEIIRVKRGAANHRRHAGHHVR